MNRLLTSGLAFCLGLGGSFAAFSASTLSDRPLVRPGVVIGQPDVSAYCRATYSEPSNSILLSYDAYGWKCVARQDRLLSFVNVDLTDVCLAQFNTPSYAATYDDTSPFTWQCIATG